MLTFIAHNVADDTDLYDNGREIIALPHTPKPQALRDPQYQSLLDRIRELQDAVGGYGELLA